MCGTTARLLSFTYSIRFHIYMNGIVKKNEFCDGVTNGGCTVQRLLFADDFAPLESALFKNCSIQHRLVEGLEAVPELDGEITLKILAGPALAPHQSVYLSS